MQFGGLELADKALPDSDGDVLRGGDLMQEFGDFLIEEAMVHGVEDLTVHDIFELLEVDDEAGAGVNFAFHRNLQDVVVTVPIEVVALAEDTAILFRREIRIVIIVRCGELRFAREIDHKKQLPVISGQVPVNGLPQNTCESSPRKSEVESSSSSDSGYGSCQFHFPQERAGYDRGIELIYKP